LVPIMAAVVEATLAVANGPARKKSPRRTPRRAELDSPDRGDAALVG
jgi:hypothetical protein